MKNIILELNSKREYLHNLPIDEIINYIDKVGKHIDNKEISKFMDKKNIIEMMNVSLRGNYKLLDKFFELTPGKLYHAQPRGLAVHWIAGNVPSLGVFSLIQTLLTKNVSIIKSSSKTYDELNSFLNKFKEVNTDKINGQEIVETFKLVSIDNKDINKNEELSQAADIRIAWGGHEAIQAIINYKKKIFCEDIIYGPKYSYAIIDKFNVNIDSARKLAFDISLFNQNACSSPHTIFVESKALEFAKLLAKELDKVNRLILPNKESDPGKTMDILSLRTEYNIKGKVFASKNVDWTVIYSEEVGLAQPCFSRVIFVRPLHLDSIKYLNTRHQQSVGLAMEGIEKRAEFVDKMTLFGVDRCPSLGNMTLFDYPWDGMFGMDRMVRWVVTWK